MVQFNYFDRKLMITNVALFSWSGQTHALVRFLLAVESAATYEQSLFRSSQKTLPLPDRFFYSLVKSAAFFAGKVILFLKYFAAFDIRRDFLKNRFFLKNIASMEKFISGKKTFQLVLHMGASSHAYRKAKFD